MKSNKIQVVFMAISLILVVCVVALSISIHHLSNKIIALRQPTTTQQHLESATFTNMPVFHRHDDIDREMRRMQEQMQQMMQQSLSTPMLTTPDPLSMRHTGDELKVKDAGDHYVITFTLPFANISKNAIKVASADQSLTISGQADSKISNNSQGANTQQQSSSHFMRTISLPQPVDVSAMTTALKDGVLTINLPKQALPLK